MKFAANTQVSSDNSRAEIERTLRRFGATGFLYGWQDNSAFVAFELNNRHIKFVLPLPDQKDPEFWKTPGRGQKRKPEAAYKEWEQATRQKWRELALGIKAKLVMVQSGITTFETEFLAHIIMANGRTIGQHIIPQIDAVIQSGKMTRLIPGIGETGN